uniref:CCDC174 alpha/beta GRSR domain-containing protein n=1 Tax=Gopherus agassizii TaxID=38772 RepID=A0A452H2S4_9SAUR
MTKGDFPDEETDLYLMDFTQKIIDKRREIHDLCESEAKIEIQIPPPQDPNEEWVDYVDSLGQSRRCMKKDLPNLLKMDKELRGKKQGIEEETLLSKDMRRTLAAVMEKRGRRGPKETVGPIHYEDIRENEEEVIGPLPAEPEAPVAPRVAESRKVKVIIQERKDTKGKFTFGQWSKKCADERDPEFATPSNYFVCQKRANNYQSQSWNKLGSSHDELGQESTQNKPFPSMQNYHNNSEDQQPVYQSLDNMLSYYKQMT